MITVPDINRDHLVKILTDNLKQTLIGRVLNDKNKRIHDVRVIISEESFYDEDGHCIGTANDLKISVLAGIKKQKWETFYF